jgi:hypothetical protein
MKYVKNQGERVKRPRPELRGLYDKNLDRPNIMLKREPTIVETAPDSIGCPVLPVPKITKRNLDRATRIRKEIDMLREELARLLKSRCK